MTKKKVYCKDCIHYKPISACTKEFYKKTAISPKEKYYKDEKILNKNNDCKYYEKEKPLNRFDWFILTQLFLIGCFFIYGFIFVNVLIILISLFSIVYFIAVWSRLIDLEVI